MLCARDAGVHDIDGDAVRAQLIRQCLGEVHQRGIAHAAQRLRASGGQPADVHDAPPSSLSHVWRARLTHTEIPDQLRVQIEQQRILVRFVQIIPDQAPRGGRAVDQNIHAAELGGRVRDQLSYRARIRRIHWPGHYGSFRGRSYFRCRLLERRGRSGSNDDRDALGSEPASRLLAYSDTAAGNNGNLPRHTEIQAHALTPPFICASVNSTSTCAAPPNTAITASSRATSVMPVQLPLAIKSPAFRPSPRAPSQFASHVIAFRGWPSTRRVVPSTAGCPRRVSLTERSASASKLQSGKRSPTTSRSALLLSATVAAKDASSPPLNLELHISMPA